MALGIETAGLETTTFQRTLPYPCQQLVIDIAVGVGGEEHQSVRVIEIPLLHLPLMLLQDGGNQRGQGHHPLLACLGAAPDVVAGAIPITSEGLADEDF